MKRLFFDENGLFDENKFDYGQQDYKLVRWSDLSQELSYQDKIEMTKNYVYMHHQNESVEISDDKATTLFVNGDPKEIVDIQGVNQEDKDIILKEESERWGVSNKGESVERNTNLKSMNEYERE